MGRTRRETHEGPLALPPDHRARRTDGAASVGGRGSWRSRWAFGDVRLSATGISHGVSKVILIGKDQSYAESGTPPQAVVATGREDNHLVGGYYRPGEVWRIPDDKRKQMAYRGRTMLSDGSAGRCSTRPWVGG
jgi:hypothetical protein